MRTYASALVSERARAAGAERYGRGLLPALVCRRWRRHITRGAAKAADHVRKPRPKDRWSVERLQHGLPRWRVGSRPEGAHPGRRLRCRHGLIDIRLRPLPAVITNRRPVVRRRSWTLGATIGRGTLPCGRIVDRYGDYLFTSESVSEGHPCNQISDAVVDAALTGDPARRVRLPEIRHHRLIVVGGEISTRSSVNPQQMTRDVLREAGYDAPILGIDFRTCYGAQHDVCPSRPSSPAAWTAGLHRVQRAGDQGMVVGYACSAPPRT